MVDEEDDGSWDTAFIDKFQSRQGVEDRLKAERRAGRTAKQRARKPPKKQLNVRATEQTHALITRLTAHFGSTATDVIELAVARLAELEGVK